MNITADEYCNGFGANQATNHNLEPVPLMIYELKKSFKTLRLRLNGRHFTDDTFKRIFLYENVGISIKINNIPALVQVIAWRRPGDKPSTEPMVVRLLTHICITRPQ